MGFLSASIRGGLEVCLPGLAEKLPKRWQGWLLVALGPVIALLGMVVFSHTTPKESSLTPIRGTVVSAKTRTPEGGLLSFRLDNFVHELSYPDWCPHFEVLRVVLQPGRKAVVWVSDSSMLSKVFGPEVWRIDDEHDTLVSYKELVEARQKNKFCAGIVALMGLACLVGRLVELLSKGKQTSDSQPSPERL